MEPTIIGYKATGHGKPSVHDWRVSRLTHLGIPVAVAESYADRVDWHQVARLVRHGCSPRLALRILC